ncbi:MAG: PHP domain-containing protein [Kiritimatiellia bacterium]|nr:PHP domain-containing protein [Kiritimatiellia bacterium]
MPASKIKSIIRVLAHSNWHIHTCGSNCASRNMTVANIIQAAESAGLETLALTDHHYPGQDILKNVENIKRDVSNYRTRVKIYVGAELSAVGPGVYADPEEINSRIPYRLYAANHYHWDIWRHPPDRSPQGYAMHQSEILKKLILSGRADCIAHPFQGVYLQGIVKDPVLVTKALTDEELAAVLLLGRKKTTWEISTCHLLKDIEFARRYISIGLELGVSFRLGTDAHSLEDVDPKDATEYLVRLL